MRKIFLCFILSSLFFQGCNYLDIVPDNVATLDNAFADKHTTESYLLTCYAGLPVESSVSQNPAFFSGDEFWCWEAFIGYTENTGFEHAWQIARGNQNANDPYANFYEGRLNGKDLFEVIRKCNIFIERVDGVLGLDSLYIKKWKAEAKTIKAYCIFYLMRMYGPIPLIKENTDVSAEPEDIHFTRNTWDECVDYVIQLLDEATPELPYRIDNKAADLGRLTQAITLAIKAKVLITSASPQFNGNPFYERFTNNDGSPLFGAKDDMKWQKAVDACKAAIDAAIASGCSPELYHYTDQPAMNDTIRMEYTLRGSVTDDKWNDELVWGSVLSPGDIQKYAFAYLDPEKNTYGGFMHTILGVNMKIVKQFYTSHGVPIDEDKEWEGRNIEELRDPVGPEKYRITETTAQLNFEREPRFYASLGFNRGVWYGAGKSYTNPYTLHGYSQEIANIHPNERSCITGYWAKKLVNLESYQPSNGTFSGRAYPWPVIRLADLYLLYAEALNEVEGPSATVYQYIDLVRQRAGLKGVQDSWAQYSKNPAKPSTQSGLREIIQRERLIELALEGQRFWDLRRWLRAEVEFRTPVTGWDNTQDADHIDLYYKEKLMGPKADQSFFTVRDYLWPIRSYVLTINPNLSQTVGW